MELLRSRWLWAGLLVTAIVASSGAAVFVSPLRARLPSALFLGTADNAAPGAAGPGVLPVNAKTAAGPEAPAARPTAGTPARSAVTRAPSVARRGPISDELPLSGRVGGEQELPLRLNATGRIAAVPIRPGQTVQRDQVLVELDTRDLEKELASARGRLEDAVARSDQAQANRDKASRAAAETQTGRELALGQASANVDRALVDLQRVRTGLNPDDRPAAEALNAVGTSLNAARVALDRGRAAPLPESMNTDPADDAILQKQIERASTEVSALEHDLDAARLRAPFDGIVLSVRARVGDSIDKESSDAQNPAVIVARGDMSIVRADVSDDDLTRLAIGQKALVTLDGVNHKADAVLVGIDAASRGTGHTARLKVSWQEPPKLGTAVEVSVITQEKTNALLVPRKSVHSAGQKHYVEVLDGLQHRPVMVTTGIVGTDDVEIVDGIQEGQQILTGY